MNVKKTLSVGELKDMIESKGVLVIDSRSPEDFNVERANKILNILGKTFLENEPGKIREINKINTQKSLLLMKSEVKALIFTSIGHYGQ